MRDGLLVRHFFWRFLEHDLVSPASDRRVIFLAAVALLTALSLFTAVLVAMPYQFFNAMPRGVLLVQSLDDRFLFVAMSMLVTGLAAAAQWDALMLDSRDTAILGTLPIPHGLIVRSKFAATGIFAVTVLASWNICPTLLRASAIPLGLRLSWSSMLQLTFAHAVVTCAAGAFGFLAVLGLREAVYAVVGSVRFQRVSTVLQAMLIMLLVTALLLLLLPGHSSRIGRRWLASNEHTIKALPPLWFVGLHETLAVTAIESGTIFEDVPRGVSRERLARDDAAATALYSSLRPGFPTLAHRAVTALLIVTGIALTACLWNSRRLPSPITHLKGGPNTASRLFNALVTRTIANTSMHQAGFFFALHAMFRPASNRLILTAAAAAAMSLMIVAGFRPTQNSTSVDVGLLATQTLVIGIVLTGFSHITRVPAEVRGSLTFGLAWQGSADRFVAGVKRAGWIGLLVPALTAMFLWYVSILGLRVAVLHLGVGVSVATVMMDALFFHCRRVPLASNYPRAQDVKVTVMLYGAGLLAAAFTLALVERASLSSPSTYIALLAALFGMSQFLKSSDHISETATIVLDVDEDAEASTLRFSLTG